MPDIVTGQVFTNGQQGITHILMNNIIGQSVIQPSFISSKQVGTLLQNADTIPYYSAAGQAIQQIPFSAFSAQVSLSQQGQNSAINGCGIINQRNTANNATFVNNAYPWDRWQTTLIGTNNVPKTSNNSLTTPVQVGNNPFFTQAMQFGVVTAAAAPVSSENASIFQNMEWGNVATLFNGFSVSFAVQSNWTGTIYFTARDSGGAKSFPSPVFLTGDSVWRLIQIGGIPAPPAGGTYNFNSEFYSLILGLSFSCGPTLRAPSDNTWQSGVYFAGQSMGNFCSSTSNVISVSQFMVNPGPLCLPYAYRAFPQELGLCQRFFSTSFDYGVSLGTATSPGYVSHITDAAATARGTVRFPVPMRLAPAVTMYNYNTGASGGTAFDGTSSASIGSAFAAQSISSLGFGGVGFTSGGTAGHSILSHYSASSE